METQNASSESNLSEPAETAPEPSTVQAEPTAEDGAPLTDTDATSIRATVTTEPKPSYVKLAMRNMVRKRGLSLQHFTLTTIGLLAFFVGLAYLTR
ncbi:MAG: DUF3285 domain-containing protein [Tildeniella nuda ZEHNDER 1965/U140]|jgi:uncharacterized membrane protein|nr:DUF3285 domain-containing protein [Tildeniella nuda ZEHNDER 1965/U140]